MDNGDDTDTVQFLTVRISTNTTIPAVVLLNGNPMPQPGYQYLGNHRNHGTVGGRFSIDRNTAFVVFRRRLLSIPTYHHEIVMVTTNESDLQNVCDNETNLYVLEAEIDWTPI